MRYDVPKAKNLTAQILPDQVYPVLAACKPIIAMGIARAMFISVALLDKISMDVN